MSAVRQVLKKVLPANTGTVVATVKAARATGLMSAWLSSRANASRVLRLGSEYGGWVVPAGSLDADSVCYCAGCGEDITFDLALIQTFGCDVFGIDPTPRSVAFVEKAAAGQDQYHLLSIGLWSSDETVRFYAPQDNTHVSHSITNLQNTSEYFEADVKTVKSVMAEQSHRNLALLKLDIEGAELAVIETMLADGVLPRVLCVEYDCLTDPDVSVRARLQTLNQTLLRRGYALFWIEGRNFTFVQSETARPTETGGQIQS
ncbi:MAG: FkbM family methyltransferase [Burkholderiaceae bacterium]